MNISYKVFPNEKLFIEVIKGDITLDILTAHLMQLEMQIDFSQIKYLYFDHRDAKFLFDESCLKQISTAIIDLTDKFNFAKSIFLYKQQDENYTKTFKVLSHYTQTKNINNVNFFVDNQIKESFSHLDSCDVENIFYDFQKELPLKAS